MIYLPEGRVYAHDDPAIPKNVVPVAYHDVTLDIDYVRDKGGDWEPAPWLDIKCAIDVLFDSQFSGFVCIVYTIGMSLDMKHPCCTSALPSPLRLVSTDHSV